MKKSIEIPKESAKIMQEYLKFSEFCRKHYGKTLLLNEFLHWLDEQKVLEVTKDGLYKLKEGVVFNYKN